MVGDDDESFGIPHILVAPRFSALIAANWRPGGSIREAELAAGSGISHGRSGFRARHMRDISGTAEDFATLDILGLSDRIAMRRRGSIINE